MVDLKDEKLVNALKVIWDYMVLNQTYPPCDLIIGCGCLNKKIPVKCASLLKEGYGKKILFTGGTGKVTSSLLEKSEAEIYSDIAMAHGVKKEDIYLETNSTNTGDNFRFSKQIIKENNLAATTILIVHGPLSERRTLATAKLYFKDQQLFITSPDISFTDFLKQLEVEPNLAATRISVVVGDIQRLIIFPQFGWQIEQEVPKDVLNAYHYLKEQGYTEFIYSPKEIKELIANNGLALGKTENLFS